MTGNVLEIQDLRVSFSARSGSAKVLDGVSLEIRKGETFGLVGESGCGKSVTANCILRLLSSPPAVIDGGHIFYSVPSERMAEIKALQRSIRAWEEAGETTETNDDMARSVARLRDLYSRWDILWNDEARVQRIRGNHISMVFQEPGSALNPVLTIGEQIAEGLLVHRRHRMAAAVLGKIDRRLEAGEMRGLEVITLRWERAVFAKMRADPSALWLRAMGRVPVLNRFERRMRDEALGAAGELLKQVRIPDPQGVLAAYPFELSGGMQQRAMIAMALACGPRLLIADEPTTSLDVTTQAQILKLMRDLQEETGASVLLITHNLGIVAENCHRVGVMYAGAMCEVCGVEELFKAPLHPYTRGLLASIPRIDSKADRLEPIEGFVPDPTRPPSGCRFHPRCPHATEACRTRKPRMREVSPGHAVSCHLYEGER